MPKRPAHNQVVAMPSHLAPLPPGFVLKAKAVDVWLERGLDLDGACAKVGVTVEQYQRHRRREAEALLAALAPAIATLRG